MKEQEIFEHFDGVYENREQYNMAWAFKDAQKKLDDYKEEVIDSKMKKQCSFCKKMNKEYKTYQSRSHSEVKKQKMISKIFGHVHGIINIIEVILSVLLVLLISEISHGDYIPHETKAFSVWVVLVFAFIKVFIEHHILKPQIEQWGWKLYKNSVNVLKNLTSDISDQVSYELSDQMTFELDAV